MSFAPTRQTLGGRTAPRPASAVEKALHAARRITMTSGFTLAVMTALTLWEAAFLCIKAGRTPLWYDELLTLHVSALQPFSAVLQALQTGVDGMPVGYYLIVRLARMLPVDPHIAVRLPSILGYILTMLGIYWFARRRLPPLTALTAVLLLTMSPLRDYATEARSYPLLVGSLAISAVLWQRIGEKRFITLLFALTLTVAVALHHYALVVVCLFGIAELMFVFVSRRVRWGVWGAMVVATCPFFLSLPTLLHFRAVFGQYFWSKPSWWTFGSTYQYYFGLDRWVTLALVLSCGLVLGGAIVRVLLRAEREWPRDSFTPPELMLIGGFLSYPALLVMLTKLLGAGYVPRYGSPAIIGILLGLLCLLGSFVQPGVCLATALLILLPFSATERLRVVSNSNLTKRWITLTEVSREEPNIPVVVASGLTFLEAKEYIPPEIHDRLVGLPDPTMAIRFVHSDTTDRAILLLARYVPLPLQKLTSFEASHDQFILCSGGIGDWLTAYLMEKKHRFSLLAYTPDADYSVYLVTR